MKKNIYVTIMVVILCSSSSIRSQEDQKQKGLEKKDDFFRFSNEKFRFSILLPKKWGSEKIDLDYKFVMILSNKNSAEIKITASAADDVEKEKWDTWSEWYATDIGNSLKIILEKDNDKAGAKYQSKIIVFQYNRQNNTILKRIMISRYLDKILVIECGAAIQSFYDYEKIFNNVMRSLDVNL